MVSSATARTSCTIAAVSVFAFSRVNVLDDAAGAGESVRDEGLGEGAATEAGTGLTDAAEAGLVGAGLSD